MYNYMCKYGQQMAQYYYYYYLTLYLSVLHPPSWTYIPYLQKTS